METRHTNSNQKPVMHESYLRHRRQSTWQIFLPIIFGSVLVLAAAVLVFLPVVGVSTGVNSSRYADTSLIWLILPVLFLAVLIAFLMIGLIIVIAKALQTIPGYTRIGQDYAKLISSTVQYWSGRFVSPIISFKSRLASFKRIFNSFSRGQEE